jgi:hypothetical protein
MTCPKLLILLFTFFQVQVITGQYSKDYNAYYNQIITIEMAVANEDFIPALNLYASLFHQYENIFARDAYNACQLAALMKHKEFNTFLSTCGKSGVDKTVLLHNYQITKAYQADSITFNSIWMEGYQKYLVRIDTSLRREWEERFAKEQAHKGKADYKHICIDNFNRILHLAKSGSFPGENLIGVNEDLENAFVFATLKDYPYSYSYIKNYLWSSVQSGGTQPLSVLYVYGFNQTRTSVLYTSDVPVDTVNFKISYNLPFGRPSTDLEKVNQQRKIRGVFSVETQQQLEAVSRKYHLDFKEGY